MSFFFIQATAVFVTYIFWFFVLQSILQKWQLASRDQTQEPLVFLGGPVPLGLQVPLERTVSRVRWESVAFQALRVPLVLLV